MRSRSWLLIGLAALGGISAPPAGAKSLQQGLEGLIGPGGIILHTATHKAHFSSSSASTLGLLVGTLAATAADYPVVATTPGFVYTYNPDLHIYERTSGSLGSIFVERGDTVGQGHFTLGTSYLHLNFQQLNGEDLDGLSFTLKHDQTQAPKPPFEKDTMTLTFNTLSLTSNIFSFYGTYGLTDRWDVNLVVPLIQTNLDADLNARINPHSRQADGRFFHDFCPKNGCPNGVQRLTKEFPPFSNGATGVGDILLRTKYRFAEPDDIMLAGALTLRLPSGNEDNFQGIGNVVITPAFIASRSFGLNNVHANLAIDFNAGDSTASRGRWAIGGTIQPFEKLAFIADFFGSSSLDQQTVSSTLQVKEEKTTNPLQTHEVTRTFSESFRTDLANANVGVKWNPFETAIVYASAIVPLTSDGLKPGVIPAVGFEYTF